MAEQVNIASLTINVDDVVKESAKLKREIETLRKAQKQLDKTTTEGAQAYEVAEVEIKKLSKSYKDNQQLAVALDKTTGDLTKAMESEGKSTQELYDSRTQLQKVAKNIKGDTEDEIKLRNQLNEAIDKQTDKIREQSSSYIKGKDSIGEYTQGINASDLSLQNIVRSSQEAGGATNLVSGGLKSAVGGMLSFTKASIAFIATPIGAVLALIAGAFLLIKNAMNRSEESSYKMKKSFAGLTGVFKTVLKVIQPLGEYLIEGIVEGMKLVEEQVIGTIKNMQRFLSSLGFEDAAESVGKFAKEVEKNIEAAKQLADAEYELAKAQRISRKTQLDYQKQAEKLRQARDDEFKTIPQRIKANEDLGKVLKKQLEDELNLANKALVVANKRIALEGETTELLDERAAAITEIADIQERIVGQESEQLTERVALIKEGAEKAVAAQQAELDAFLKAQELRKKSLAEELAVEQQAAEQRIAILDRELKFKLISQREYNAEIQNIQVDLAKKQAELNADNARRELEEYQRLNESKIDSDLYFSDQTLQIELQRLNNLAEARREYEAIRLKEGIISQQEYNDRINEINRENEASNEALTEQRAEAQKAKEAIDAQNRIAIFEAQAENETEILRARLEREREAEVASAEQTGADIALINEKYATQQAELEEKINSSTLDGYKQVFDGYASALGEQTALGKAAAIASTLISTYQGAQNAYTSLAGIPVVGPGLGAAAAAAAVTSGIKQVQQIKSTPTEFARGDILRGASHANGGIPFSIGQKLGFEAEGGEALINKKSTAMFRPLLSEINAAGGGKRFANGGIAGASASTPTGSLIDIDLLANRISQANESLPAPVVSVEEISRVGNNVSAVENLATEA